MSKRQRGATPASAVVSIVPENGADLEPAADFKPESVPSQDTTTEPAAVKLDISTPPSSPARPSTTEPSTAEAAGSPPPRNLGSPAVPPSPTTNRDRFRAALMPMQISCDLSSVSTETGLRWSFQAIVTVVYPAAQNPARRYVLLSDGRGTVGLTVWNPHVNSFSFNSVGKMAHFTKVSLTIHNNVKSISLNKESSVVLDDGVGHFAHTWWNSFTSQPSLPAIHFHDLQDNTIGKAQQLEAHHRNLTFCSQRIRHSGICAL